MKYLPCLESNTCFGNMLNSLPSRTVLTLYVEPGQTLSGLLGTLELLCKLTNIRRVYMYSSDRGTGPSCPKKYRVSEFRNALDEYKDKSHDLEAYEKVHAPQPHSYLLGNTLH